MTRSSGVSNDPRASFLMFDTEQDTVRFHRVDYDLAACLEKAARAGLLREEGLLRRSARRIRKSIGKAARAMLREG